MLSLAEFASILSRFSCNEASVVPQWPIEPGLRNQLDKCMVEHGNSIPLSIKALPLYVSLAFHHATLFPILRSIHLGLTTVKMRSTLIISAFAALALAAPHPQDIEFDQVDAAPDPEPVTPPVIGTSQTVSIQPAAAVVTLADASVTDTASTNDKRDFLEVSQMLDKRGSDGDCSALPQGTGPQVST